MAAKSEAAPIEALRVFLSAVLENAKREQQGKHRLDGQERRAAKPVLAALLGRAPTENEIETALSI